MFWKRLGSGIILIILIFAILIPGGYITLGALTAVSVIAFHELFVACGLKNADEKIGLLKITGYIAVFAYYMVLAVTKESMSYLFLTIVFILMAFMCVYVFSFPKYKSEQIMQAFYAVVYGPVMLSCIYLTREMKDGIYLVWMIFISSWLCDTCAYVVGMLLGKHKLCPKLSPKKSIEGAVGGVAGAALGGALYGWWLSGVVSYEQNLILIFAIIAGCGSVISQVGDLAASAIKRNNEIKDYGNLIPGHGGIMDRFDSVIFTAPIIFALSYMILK